MLQIKYSKDIEQKMKTFFYSLNKKDRRHYAVLEVLKLGPGGQKYISSVLGCRHQTVMTGIDEIVKSKETTEEIIRKPGSGRKKIIDTGEKIDEVFFDILNHHTLEAP